jgi:hypothetical protein
VAHHVYDHVYYKVMTITILWHVVWRHQSSTTHAWTKLNEMMLKHGFAKSNFKGFMANNTHANWNITRIVYGSRDPFVRMVDKKCTCLFHWIQLLNKHIEQLIKLNLQNQHNVLCHKYKNAKSLVEASSLYVIICCWWLSLGATFEACVHELAN